MFEFIFTHPYLYLSLLMVLDTAFSVVPFEILIGLAIVLKINPLTLGMLGAVSCMLGAWVDYYLGFWSGRFVFKRISAERLEWAKEYLKRYGPAGILVSRIIPFIPYKPISMICGMLNYNLLLFLSFTAIGSFLRFYIESIAILKSGVELKKASYFIGRIEENVILPHKYLVTSAITLVVILVMLYLVAGKNIIRNFKTKSNK
ncbi:MAG: VTT domain-containing protein [Euryarchaeota archaeon]|nr:VTT domain-containing protein [Euryarchaeota archaeon]